MAHRIHIEPHLSLEQVRERFRTAKRGSEKTRWQVIWLIGEGRTSHEVAATTGYSLNWVRDLVGRYNREGPGMMEDRRAHNPGPQPLLSPEQKEELRLALNGAAPRGGLWSGPDVAQWMSDRLQRAVAPQRGWDYLRGLGFTPQVPRPRHAGTDPQAQEAFQARAAHRRRPRAAGPPASGP